MERRVKEGEGEEEEIDAEQLPICREQETLTRAGEAC